MAVREEKDGSVFCMHADRPAARDTIRRLRELGQMEGVHLALAHVDVDDTGDDTLKALLI
jgi:CTP:molybdopterin cytidylyltransferase MocA